MTTDRPRRPDQRFSRYSRANYDEILPPPPPEEPTLTDIAMRALNGHHEAPQRGMVRDDGRHQPPPPEPGSHWLDEREAQRPPMRPSGPVPQQRAQGPAPMPRDTEQEARPPRRLRETANGMPAPERMTARQSAEGARALRPQHTAEAGPKPPSAFARAMTAARVKTGPALMKSAFWLARNLRRREIRKRYSRALVFGHTRIADRRLEKLFFVPTAKTAMIDPAPERGIHYDGPVPSAVFNWIMATVPVDLRQFAFIDIRAGLGRTALLAAKSNFGRIRAYEYDPQIFDSLQMNVAQYPRSLMACRKIDCYRGDVDGISLPDQPCIIYFSGAWREKMIPGVMNYVRDTYRQSPRRIYVVLENTDDDTGLAEDNIFQRIEPPLAERMKLKLLSPVDIRIYRSVV